MSQKSARDRDRHPGYIPDPGEGGLRLRRNGRVSQGRRRAVLAGLALPLCGQVSGQASKRTHLVVYWGVWFAPGEPSKGRIAWFEDALSKQGYVVGRNLQIEYFFTPAEGVESLPELAKQIVALNPDVIFLTLPGPRTRASIRALNA